MLWLARRTWSADAGRSPERARGKEAEADP